MKIMMICTGNICRSAMADIVLREQLEAAGITDIVVDSAGVSAEESGNPIDYRAARILAENGYGQGQGHRAKQVRDTDFADTDLFLAMTSSHYAALERLRERYGSTAEIRMYREFDPSAQARHRRDLDVPDPWYGDMEDFRETFAVVEKVTPALIEQFSTASR